MASATKTFADLSGQELRIDKSFAFTTVAGGRKAVALGEGRVPWQTSGKIVGAQLSFQGAPCIGLVSDKMDEACKMCVRLGWCPFGFYDRSLAIQSRILPKALYACAVQYIPGRLISKLQTSIVKAVWGPTRALRCKEIVLSLFVPTHLVDPQSYMDYSSLVLLRRMMLKRPEWTVAVQNVWATSQSSKKRTACGPIGKAAGAVSRLGWEWPEPCTFRKTNGEQLPMLTMTSNCWQHEIRESLRLALWKAAEQRRPEMKGIGQGIDRSITMQLLNSRQLGDVSKGTLRAILAGAVWTNRMLAKA
eukprot:5416688-Karenia_brevis.AAC.1